MTVEGTEHTYIECMKNGDCNTFPKLPLPMARNIWKWSKFTAKKMEKKERGRLCQQELWLGHDTKHSSIMNCRHGDTEVAHSAVFVLHKSWQLSADFKQSFENQ